MREYFEETLGHFLVLTSLRNVESRTAQQRETLQIIGSGLVCFGPEVIPFMSSTTHRMSQVIVSSKVMSHLLPLTYLPSLHFDSLSKVQQRSLLELGSRGDVG